MLAEHYGVLDEATARELEAIVEERRAARNAAHRVRVERVRNDLDTDRGWERI